MLNRFIYSNNGVLTDFSRDVFRYQTGSAVIPDFIAAQDYFYIGALAPFNHFYFKMLALNLVANELSVSYWDGRVWVNVKNLIDETAGFTKSGFIYFVPDKDKGWLKESTNDKGDQVDGLTSVSIYDMYWIRISSNQNLTANMSFSWIGQKFSDDLDLGAEFPDLNRTTMLQAFGTGKTNWEEQHVKAAEIIIKDLITSEIISLKEQVLLKEEFTLASVQKVAEIIYAAMGDDYIDQKNNAKIEYKERLNKSIYRTDTNENAILDIREHSQRSGFLNR
jgi:hypothetical protein